MHALRHFYASVLIDAGESVKAVADYLGIEHGPGIEHLEHGRDGLAQGNSASGR